MIVAFKPYIIGILGVLALTGLIMNMIGFDGTKKFKQLGQQIAQMKQQEKPKKAHTYKPAPVYQHETFTDFYDRFVLDDQFRTTRMFDRMTEGENQMFHHVLQYADFVNEDSLQTHWVYSIRYRDSLINMDFKIIKGKWFLVDLK